MATRIDSRSPVHGKGTVSKSMSVSGLVCALAALFAALVLWGCPPRQTPPGAETEAPPRPARIAVVLGAGASKGFAHIGVLKVLEAQKVPIHMVVGTSAGSLVGSLYAYGLDGFALQDMALKIEKKHVIDYTVPDNGFIKGEKLEDFVNATVRNTPIEKLRRRFFAVATDIARGEEAVFVSGNTGKAVRASCSVPGVFQPVKMSGRTYVDGGVVSPVAVDVARRYGADVVIAVDISGGIAGEVPQGTLDTILQSVDIMYAKISEYQLKKADVVIRPDVRNIGSTEMEKRHQAILEGEKAAYVAMPQISRILDDLKKQGRL
ncbi:MAG TPA: patatin-like phospholipase family protein [Deltaproteobacteria bacterium]|nr:patatin-like phospholipase family protein [Deltaproteobacteria bacterium]